MLGRVWTIIFGKSVRSLGFGELAILAVQEAR